MNTTETKARNSTNKISIFLVLFIVVLCIVVSHPLYIYCNLHYHKCKSKKYLSPEMMQTRFLVFDRLLQFVSKVTRHARAEWIIAYGTLLGAVREKDYIPHDYDADVMVFSKDVTAIRKAIALENELNNFIVIDAFSYSGTIQIFDMETSLAVDMFFFDEPQAPETMYRLHSWTARNIFLREIDRDEMQYEHIFPIQWKQFREMVVPVPNDPHALLSSHYGKDYMTPNSKWRPNKF